MAQIVFLNTNMSDARRRLPEEQFFRVFSLFRELLSEQKTMRMDHRGYIDMTVKAVKRFDRIASYEVYCGRDEGTMKSFMDKVIRAGNPASGTEAYFRWLKEHCPEATRKEAETILAANDVMAADHAQNLLKMYEYLPTRQSAFKEVRSLFENAFSAALLGRISRCPPQNSGHWKKYMRSWRRNTDLHSRK